MEDVRTYFATPGRVIRDPRTKARVPHEGEPIRVVFSSYWARRETDGDVIRVNAEPAAQASKRAAKEG